MSNRFRFARCGRLVRKALASLAVVPAVSCFENEATNPERWTAATPVARIEIEPTSLNLRIGTQATLTAQAYDSSGRATVASFSWNTSDPSVATVSRNDPYVGMVTAVGAGEATITVSGPSHSVSVKVTVPPDPATAIRIKPDELTLSVPATFQLIAAATDAAGRPTPAFVEWSSEDPAVATVDHATGVVTAVGVGMTNVSASVGSVKASIPVRVEPADFLRQWAANATASSSYSNDPEIWSAWQATGAPNVTTCEDESRSWASLDFNEDWLELTYAEPVRPSEIVIHEVWAPGSIVKVEVKDLAGAYHVVYQASTQVRAECLRKLTIPVEGVTELVNVVRVTVDQRVRKDWNEIDAVRLSGYRK